MSTALVLLMIPGVGFFYSGLARRKSALSLIWLSMMSVAVVSFQVSKLFGVSLLVGVCWFLESRLNRSSSPFNGAREARLKLIIIA